MLASGGTGGTVRLWKPPADVGVLKSHSDVVNSIAFFPDAHFLAFGGDDGQLHVWAVPERQPIVDGPKEKHAITAVTVVGSGTVLYGLGGRPDPVVSPATLMLLDLPSGRPRKFSFPVVHGIRALAGLPDRRLAAWATDNKILRLQDITRPPGKAHTLKNDCRALALSADGRRLAVTSDWDVLLFEVERAWPVLPTTLGRHQGVASALAFSPDGRTLFSGGWDNAVRVWDLDRGTERATYTWPIGNRVVSLAVSPDGLRAAASGDVGTIAVWDLD
jgi:WD40 repeat protein